MTKCTFHDGFSPAFGVIGTHNLELFNNVVHHTVGSGEYSIIDECTRTFVFDAKQSLLKERFILFSESPVNEICTVDDYKVITCTVFPSKDADA